jgi:CDP-diacylglycerol--glycerol-3-phosphate 3-phosphatidyltransferase
MNKSFSNKLSNGVGSLRTTGITSWIRIIPAWVPANVISLTRALLVIPIYFAYINRSMTWVFVLYLAAWLTDIIDGLHARYRHQQSMLGKFLDPGADKVLVIGLLVLISPGRFSTPIIYTILGLEIIIILITIIIGPLSRYFFHNPRKLGANLFGKMKMLCEGLSLAVLLIGLDNRTAQIVAESIMWCAALLAVVSIIFYLTSKETKNARD